jgi:hypothetical protein
MRVAAVVVLLLVMVGGGCESSTAVPRTADEQQMFGPSAMRIHPIFTRVKDWTGDGKSDGIEALVEFQDAFGDPTKATGKVIFELFDYRPDEPDAKGNRVVNPWIGSLEGPAEQQERWNRTSRTYSFQLAYDAISSNRPYVLTATFELSTGGRFFDRVILEPQRQQEPRRVAPTTLPIPAAPTTRTPEP